MVDVFAHSGGNPKERSELLRLNGPILPVLIRNPQREHTPAAVDSTDSGLLSVREANGLIDTGATSVLIEMEIAQSLGLVQTGMSDMRVVGGQVDAVVFAGQLEVPQLGYSKILPMLAPRRGQISHSVLLGRSFLEDFIVTFDGPSGIFVLARPKSNYAELHSDQDHAHI